MSDGTTQQRRGRPKPKTAVAATTAASRSEKRKIAITPTITEVEERAGLSRVLQDLQQDADENRTEHDTPWLPSPPRITIA